MTLFVDTSGIIALVDRDDPKHPAVVDAFGLGRSETLATHSYVIVETLALARRRFGSSVTAHLIDAVMPALEVVTVDAVLHAQAVRSFRSAIGSSVSLVDHASFAFMRQRDIDRAIALDADFRAAGLTTIP